MQNLLELCEKHDLDGVDFDWESPMSESQLSAYVRLLHEAHATFSQRGLVTSVALHPGQTLGPGGFLAVDRVHLMAYDMSFQRGGGHHADYGAVKAAVQQAIGRADVPPEKLVVGIPAYARHGEDLPAVKSYAEIVDMMAGEGGDDDGKPLAERLDPAFKARNEYEGYLYDCVLSAQRKTAWAKSMGLAGVFIWEVGQDKVEPHVSLTEGVMAVGNGTKEVREAVL